MAQIQEPPSAYATQYPYNNVMQTESGHFQEFDDTPGAERMRWQHKAGTFTEWQPDGTEVIGTIATHPTDSSLLLYSPFDDTTPANTVSPITAIIDPSSANINTAITQPNSGTRYLIVNDIDSTNTFNALWTGTDNQDLVANAHDIIQYNGVHWTVVFDSRNIHVLNYVTNLTTGIQYKWQDQQWTKSYDGVYRAGEWMLSI